MILLGVLAYLGLVAAIGVWASSRTRSPRDYFIAGQRLGPWGLGLATMSASFSGFVFVGGPGLTYRVGLASLWIVAPVGFTAALLCWTVGPALRRLAADDGVYTIPDAVARRFGGRLLPALTAVAIVWGAVAYLGLQVHALSVLLSGWLDGWPLVGACALCLLVLLAYSLAGGMVAGAYTDIAQGMLMLLVSVAVFVQALRVSGGLAGWQAVAASPEFGDWFFAAFGRLTPGTAFGFYFLFGVGVCGQPHLLHKFFMIERERDLARLPAILAGSQMLCLLTWIGIGCAIPALVAQGAEPPLVRPDDAAARFLIGHCAPPLAALTLAGVVAAVMSTADSFLNLASAALVRDLPRAWGAPVRNELAAARVASVAVLGLATAFAVGQGELVALVGASAFAVFAASLAPTLALGLSWERVGRGAATASVVTGLVLAPALDGAVALAASLAVLVVGACFPRGRSRRGGTTPRSPARASPAADASPVGRRATRFSRTPVV